MMSLAHTPTRARQAAQARRSVQTHVIAHINVAATRPPVAYHQPASLATWDEVTALQEALRDAERERDMMEDSLLRHDEETKQLTGRVRQLAMAQATFKIAVQDLKGMLTDAQRSAALEHRHLFGEKLHVCGKSFRDEDSVVAYLGRQEQGMARLNSYHNNIVSMTGSLKSLLSKNVASL